MSWKRSQYRKKYNKRLLNSISESYPSPIYYDKDKERIVRLYRHEGLHKKHQRIANKRLRKNKEFEGDGGHYKKDYALWWMIY